MNVWILRVAGAPVDVVMYGTGVPSTIDQIKALTRAGFGATARWTIGPGKKYDFGPGRLSIKVTGTNHEERKQEIRLRQLWREAEEERREKRREYRRRSVQDSSDGVPLDARHAPAGESRAGAGAEEAAAGSAGRTDRGADVIQQIIDRARGEG